MRVDHDDGDADQVPRLDLERLSKLAEATPAILYTADLTHVNVGLTAIIRDVPRLINLAEAARLARLALHAEDNERATILLDQACAAVGWL